MVEMLSNPRVTKVERCIEFLKMLPVPLFPLEVEVHKIVEAVPCHRATVYRARDELKLRYILLHQEAGVALKDPKNVKNVTLRSVNLELLSHVFYLYNILEKILETGDLPYFDNYDKTRLGLIEGFRGKVDAEPDEVPHDG